MIKPQVIFKGVIHGYQLMISPFMLPCCRFFPNCSEYALEAIERYGCLKGTGLMVLRLLKCHPLHRGGIDEVP